MIYLLLQDYSMTLVRCIRRSFRSFIGGIICFYCYLDIFMGVQHCYMNYKWTLGLTKLRPGYGYCFPKKYIEINNSCWCLGTQDFVGNLGV